MVGGEVKWKKESEQGWEGRNRKKKEKKEGGSTVEGGREK